MSGVPERACGTVVVAAVVASGVVRGPCCIASRYGGGGCGGGLRVCVHVSMFKHVSDLGEDDVRQPRLKTHDERQQPWRIHCNRKARVPKGFNYGEEKT